MDKKEAQVRALFEKMLTRTEKYANTYEHYAKDMKKFRKKVQWNIGPIKGYQVYNESEYTFEKDGEIENPDITIEFGDFIVARKFFKDYYNDMRDLAADDFEISSPKVPDIGNIDAWRMASSLVTKLPPFRRIMERTHGAAQSTAVSIPINENLGRYNNEIMPVAVVEHFINKAAHIFLYDICPCRVFQECKDFSHTDFGCMVLGRGVLRMKPNDGFHVQGRLGTKEEAIDRVRKGVAAGLIPGFGRLRGDAINRIGGPTPDTGDLFNFCLCCPCCCVVGGIKDSPSYLRKIFKKMEGLEVAVDVDTCTECGDCTDVCIFGALEMVEGHVERDFEKCVGCGRCVTVCPTESMSISLEEGGIEKMIARIEERVDVT